MTPATYRALARHAGAWLKAPRQAAQGVGLGGAPR